MKENRSALIAMSLGNFAVGIGVLIIAGIIEPMAAAFEVSLSTIGLLVTIYAVAYALSSPILVSLTGRVSRRTILTIALLLLFVGNVLGATAVSYLVVFVGRMIMAFGAAIYTPAATATAAALTAPEDRGKAIAFVYTGFTAANALGLPLGTFVGLNYGWRLAFWLVAVMAGISAVFLWRDLPKDVQVPTVNLATVGRTLLTPTLLLLFVITILQIASQLVIFTYIAPLFGLYLGVAAAGVTLLLLVNGVASVVGNLAAGESADRLGTRKTLLLLLAVLTVVLFSFPLMRGSMGTAVFLLICWGLVSFAFQAPQQSRLIGLAPSAQNAVLSLNASAIYVGTASGSFIGGLFVDSVGLESLSWVGGSIAAVGVVLMILSWNVEKRVTSFRG